jgi:sulfur dioxygenase
MQNSLIFYQLFDSESSTCTYLLADSQSREAVIIDSVLENKDRDLKLISELGLKLIYILDTHIHADHITAASLLRKVTGAKTGISEVAGVGCADLMLKENDSLFFGVHQLSVISTPGHTDGCTTFKVGNKIFTGDTLLVRGTGRTDFQGGSSEKLYESLQKLFKLSDDTEVFPGHDYTGLRKSSIGLEKKFNPRAGQGKSKEEFVKIMNELKLSEPKKIKEALPANKACGNV